MTMAGDTFQNPSALERALLGLASLEKRLARVTFEPVEPVLLQAELKDIVKKSNLDTTKPLDFRQREALAERWKALKATQQWEQLTRRDLRDLISIPEAFCDPVLLNLIRGQRPFNRRLLTTILRAYLSHWQNLGVLRAEWGRLIAEAMEQPAFIQLSWPAFHHWRRIAPWLLGEQANEKLGQDLIYARGSFSDAVKSYLQLEVSCAEGSLAADARQHLLERLLALRKDELKEALAQALAHWVNPLADHQWLGRLILTAHQLRDDALIEQVKGWFLRAQGFGDVRLNPDSVGWRYMNDTARQIFTSWLSKEDLEFFFKMVLPVRDDPQRRREFWERYLPCVIRSRVLMSDEDKTRNQEVLNKMQREGKTAPGSIKNSSVFIMETKYCYILEFSEVGNAAFIYWRQEKKFYPRLYEKLETLLSMRHVKDLSSTALKVKIGEIDQLSSSDPCTSSYSIRCIHNSNWQENLRRWLNLRGIRP